MERRIFWSALNVEGKDKRPGGKEKREETEKTLLLTSSPLPCSRRSLLRRRRTSPSPLPLLFLPLSSRRRRRRSRRRWRPARGPRRGSLRPVFFVFHFFFGGGEGRCRVELEHRWKSDLSFFLPSFPPFCPLLPLLLASTLASEAFFAAWRAMSRWRALLAPPPPPSSPSSSSSSLSTPKGLATLAGATRRFSSSFSPSSPPPPPPPPFDDRLRPYLTPFWPTSIVKRRMVEREKEKKVNEEMKEKTEKLKLT